MTSDLEWKLAIEQGLTERVRQMAQQSPGVLARLDRAAEWAMNSGVAAMLDTVLDLGGRAKYILLRRAICNNQPEMLRVLLDRGLDPNAWIDHRDRPLILAAIEENTECVRVLLDHGADPELCDSDRRTALNHAIIGRNDTICRWLAERSNVDHRDSEHWTYLMLAAVHQHQELCILLLERGADLNAQSGDGRTVADLATPELYDTLCKWHKARELRQSLGSIAQAQAGASRKTPGRAM